MRQLFLTVSWDPCTCLARHTCLCPCFSVVPKATNQVKSLEGRHVSSKSLPRVQEELLGGTKDSTRQGIVDAPSGQINYFLQKKKDKWVSGQTYQTPANHSVLAQSQRIGWISFCRQWIGVLPRDLHLLVQPRPGLGNNTIFLSILQFLPAPHRPEIYCSQRDISCYRRLFCRFLTIPIN